MPMPMPIIVARDVDQSGASTREMTTIVSVLLTARPATATRIGSPAATTEPNISSRMIGRGREAEALRADLALLGLGDGLAADGDLEAVSRGAVREVEQLLGVLLRHVDGVLHVEAQVGDERVAVLADAAGVGERVGGGRDVRDDGHLAPAGP